MDKPEDKERRTVGGGKKSKSGVKKRDKVQKKTQERLGPGREKKPGGKKETIQTRAKKMGPREQICRNTRIKKKQNKQRKHQRRRKKDRQWKKDMGGRSQSPSLGQPGFGGWARGAFGDSPLPQNLGEISKTGEGGRLVHHRTTGNVEKTACVEKYQKKPNRKRHLAHLKG